MNIWSFEIRYEDTTEYDEYAEVAYVTLAGIDLWKTDCTVAKYYERDRGDSAEEAVMREFAIHLKKALS